MLKHTGLFEAHRKLGARLIDFGGWELPVQYTSIVEEHLAVRTAAGLFDISHMGEITVSGAAAGDFLSFVLTNNTRKLEPGWGQYTLLCNERGGTIDDLYAYRLSGDVFLLIVNASRVATDVAWLHDQAARFLQQSELKVSDASHNYDAVAVQGPRVREFIDLCIAGPSDVAARVAKVTDLKRNQIAGFRFADANVLVSRTGYTGEDGFEIVGRSVSIAQVWEVVLEKGHAFGLKPCGLGARDTLRTEVCYPLYGHELDENTTPIEAGVGFFVALDKGEFIGRSVLADQKANGVTKKCVAFKMAGRSAPPRPRYPIGSTGGEARTIGVVTSGTQSPSLNCGIGLGYVPPEFAELETRIDIEIRGQRAPAVVVAKPIYRKSNKPLPA
jgi:aminomethyltransferase